MFGRARRRATEHVIDAVLPLVASCQGDHGLPIGFWQSHFVLGFFGYMISFHANCTSGQKLSSADNNLLMVDVFTAITHLNGKAIGDECTRLATLEVKSDEFEQGADCASICALFSIGKANEDGMLWIEKAERMATTMGGDSDHATVFGCLMQLLFFQPLNEEFG